MKAGHVSTSDVEDDHSLCKNPTKADVITTAIRHIEHLEGEVRGTQAFVKTLQDQIEGLQKLVRCDDCAMMKFLQGKQLVVVPPT